MCRRWPASLWAYLRARVVNRAIYSRDAHFAVSGDEEGGRRKEMRDSGAIDARVEFANSLFVFVSTFIFQLRRFVFRFDLSAQNGPVG